MTIEIREEEHGDVRVLALSGRLDTETSADLELALQDLQAVGAAHFLIDLGEIGYVSSAGLRVLLALAKQLEGGRGSLKLCALNDAVQQVFKVAGFSRMFAIYQDRDSALGAPAPAAAAKARPAESELARRAAGLLGANEPTGAPVPGSAELARSAARLLGVSEDQQTAARSAEKPQPPAARPAPPRKPEPPPARKPEPEQSGVIGKIRNLFGSRK